MQKLEELKKVEDLAVKTLHCQVDLVEPLSKHWALRDLGQVTFAKDWQGLPAGWTGILWDHKDIMF